MICHASSISACMRARGLLTADFELYTLALSSVAFGGHQSNCNGSSSTVTFALRSRYNTFSGIGKDVRTLCKEGRLNEAVRILNVLDNRGIKANWETYAWLLQGCINMKALTEGKRVHAHLIKSGFKPNLFLANTLINMYLQCGNVMAARDLFHQRSERNVFTWNIMIAGYAQHGHGQAALELFWQMAKEGVKPDEVTFVSVLKACSSLAALEKGKQIHAYIIGRGLEYDAFVGSTLIDMYVKCGSVEHARQVFDKMPKRHVVSWNAMIVGYVQHGNGEEAIELFKQMQWQGMKPNKVTFIGILKACARVADLHKGKQIHAHIIERGVESDIFVGNTLIFMYGKCGSLKLACQVFHKMPRRDVVSWNAMIACYVQHGNAKDVFNLFLQMEQEGVKPDKITFVNMLKVCASTAALEQGRQLHDYIVRSGFELDIFVGSNLVDMYGKCGKVECARQVFDQMARRDVVLWTVLIAGYVQCGYAKEALLLFQQMQQEGVKPNKVTFVSILKACANAAILEQGKQFHACIIKSGFLADNLVANMLIDMYCKCGSIEHACQVFDEMPKRDVVSWNTMIAGYAQHRHAEKALKLFRQMVQESMKPDEITFSSILKACTSIAALEQGKQIHAQIVTSGFDSDVFVASSLIDMYGKCGSMQHARQVFDGMLKKDVVAWNAMISVYVQHGHAVEALELFQQMKQEDVKPNEVILVSILKACASLAALEQGKQIHADIVENGFESDAFVGNALVDMYSKCGKVELARKVFEKSSKQDVVLWNAMIGGYAQNDYPREALDIFGQMQQEGIKPDKVTFVSVLKACGSIAALEQGKQIHTNIIKSGLSTDNFVGSSLIDMYGKCGSIDQACQVFHQMSMKDMVLWNAMIAVYAQHGHGKEALELVEQMRWEDMEPNHITFVCILSACSHGGFLDEGLAYFDSMTRDYGITPTDEHYVCMVDMLGRLGHMEKAGVFIKRMPIQPTTVVWTALLNACRIHGNVELAKHSSECILKLERQNTGAVVLLSNIYAAVGRWHDKVKMRKLMGEGG